jgi:hypothetical protein
MRWENVLAPHIGHRDWTLLEDEKLVKLYGEFGDNWEKISKKMPANEEGKRRTAHQCLMRMKESLASDIRRGNWSREEDEALVILHGKWGNQWAKISEGMPTDEKGKRRTAHQCRQRRKLVLEKKSNLSED